MTDTLPAGGSSPPGAAPLVRVIVVTYSPGDSLSVFLGSLRQATTAAFEVVLADNGSTDGAPEAVADGHTIQLVRTGGNLGYGRAANVGAAGVGTPWLLVANPDVTFAPGALDRLLAVGDRWPRGGAFGPAIRTPDGALYPSARALPSLARGVGHALAGWWWPGNPWTAAYRREGGRPVEAPVGWLSGSCLLVRRDAWESVGGFDPAYFMYFEDTDLGARLGAAGWLSVYVPSAVVTHTGGHATARERRRMVRAHHVSAYRYLSRRYPGPRWAPLRAALAAGLAGRYLLSRAIPRVGEGARPTRRATLLETLETTVRRGEG